MEMTEAPTYLCLKIFQEPLKTFLKLPEDTKIENVKTFYILLKIDQKFPEAFTNLLYLSGIF